MKRWQSYRNYRKSKGMDGSNNYFIVVDGKDVEVNEAIYKEYKLGCHKMEYMECDLKSNRVLQDAKGHGIKDKNDQLIRLPELEVSLEKLMNEGYDYPSPIPSPEEIFLAYEDSDEAKLHRCLAMLTNDEQILIKVLFFEGLTEQAYAGIHGVKQQSVNERKQRILKKIKKLWQKPC